jgi:adenylate kinase
MQRDDDKPETVRARLEKQKTPADLIGHYRDAGKLVDVDGLQPIEQVTTDILTAVESKNAQKAGSS